MKCVVLPPLSQTHLRGCVHDCMFFTCSYSLWSLFDSCTPQLEGDIREPRTVVHIHSVTYSRVKTDPAKDSHSLLYMVMVQCISLYA